MTLGALTIWELQPGGSDTNGMNVNPATIVTDYSTSPTPIVAVTNAVSTGTTTVTSATAGFTAAMKGNGAYIAGAWYQIASVTNTTTVVMDRVVTTGTGLTMNVGGAAGSPGGVSLAAPTTGHIVYALNNGTPFTITSATASVSGGVVSSSAGVVWCGYQTNRNITNTDPSPIIKYGVAGVGPFSTRGSVNNIAFDGNGQTTASAVKSGDTTFYRGCSWTGMNTIATGAAFFGCKATANSTTVFNSIAMYCEAWANSATPFSATAIRSLSYNNTGTAAGFAVAGSNNYLLECTGYGNAGPGATFSGAGRANAIINSYFESNGTYAIDFSTATQQTVVNSGGYNNPSGIFSSSTSAININPITTVTSTAFVNAAGANFLLNNNAGGGAVLRGAGYPSIFAAGFTANYQDVGASQHQDTGGSSGGQTSYAFAG